MEEIKPVPPGFEAPYRAGMNLALRVGYALICLMMVSFALGVVFAGMRLSPGWKGFYLVGLALFLSVEAIYSRKRTADLDQGEKITFRIAEWIAFAVLIKIIHYLVHGPAQLVADIPQWQSKFLESFFTGEYLLTLLISLLIWWSSSAHSAELEKLYEREDEAYWEDLGKVQNILRDARNRMSSRIFVLGALLVILAAFARFDTAIILPNTSELTHDLFLPVVNVLAYFIFGTALLTQTQFTLLRARWIYQHLPVSGNLARNWMKYGVAFFVILAGIVLFLPTKYSLGLFETLQVALGYLGQVISFFFMLITLPIMLCATLFPGSEKQTPESPGGAIGGFPAAQASTPLPWWEFFKSLAFWVVFLGVIFFALRYYLMQNAALLNAIQHFPLFRWLSNRWRHLAAWMRCTGKQVNAIIKTGLKQLRPQKTILPGASLRRIINVSRLSARDKVIHYYLSLIQMAGERGIRRAPSQTPEQYKRLVNQAIPEVEEELHGLTETFLEARYSQHPVQESNAVQAGSLWERIKLILRSWRKTNE